MPLVNVHPQPPKRGLFCFIGDGLRLFVVSRRSLERGSTQYSVPICHRLPCAARVMFSRVAAGSSLGGGQGARGRVWRRKSGGLDGATRNKAI